MYHNKLIWRDVGSAKSPLVSVTPRCHLTGGDSQINSAMAAYPFVSSKHSCCCILSHWESRVYLHLKRATCSDANSIVVLFICWCESLRLLLYWFLKYVASWRTGAIDKVAMEYKVQMVWTSESFKLLLWWQWVMVKNDVSSLSRLVYYSVLFRLNSFDDITLSPLPKFLMGQQCTPTVQHGG